MPEQHEGFAVDVGSKLLFGGMMIAVFAVAALILMPIGSMFAPGPPGTPLVAKLIGGLVPGIIMLVVAVVLGALGGLLLGYAAKHGTYDID